MAIVTLVIRVGQVFVLGLDSNSFKYPKVRLLDQMGLLFLIYVYPKNYVILGQHVSLLAKLPILMRTM